MLPKYKFGGTNQLPIGSQTRSQQSSCFKSDKIRPDRPPSAQRRGWINPTRPIAMEGRSICHRWRPSHNWPMKFDEWTGRMIHFYFPLCVFCFILKNLIRKLTRSDNKEMNGKRKEMKERKTKRNKKKMIWKYFSLGRMKM